LLIFLKRLPGAVANAVDLDRSSETEGFDGRSTCDGLLTLYREKIVNEMRSLRVNKGDVEMNVYSTDPDRRALKMKVVVEGNGRMMKRSERRWKGKGARRWMKSRFDREVETEWRVGTHGNATPSELGKKPQRWKLVTGP
jgi:hypothetical protein